MLFSLRQESMWVIIWSVYSLYSKGNTNRLLKHVSTWYKVRKLLSVRKENKVYQ